MNLEEGAKRRLQRWFCVWPVPCQRCWWKGMGPSLLVTEPCEQGRFSGVFHGVQSECGTPLSKKGEMAFPWSFRVGLEHWGAKAGGALGWGNLWLILPAAMGKEQMLLHCPEPLKTEVSPHITSGPLAARE